MKVRSVILNFLCVQTDRRRWCYNWRPIRTRTRLETWYPRKMCNFLMSVAVRSVLGFCGQNSRLCLLKNPVLNPGEHTCNYKCLKYVALTSVQSTERYVNDWRMCSKTPRLLTTGLHNTRRLNMYWGDLSALRSSSCRYVCKVGFLESVSHNKPFEERERLSVLIGNTLIVSF